MAKDRIQKELEVGAIYDLVLRDPLNAAHTIHLSARLVRVTPGGISMIGGMKHGQKEEIVTPGTASFLVEYNINYDPNHPVIMEAMQIFSAKEVEAAQPKLVQKA